MIWWNCYSRQVYVDLYWYRKKNKYKMHHKGFSLLELKSRYFATDKFATSTWRQLRSLGDFYSITLKGFSWANFSNLANNHSMNLTILSQIAKSNSCEAYLPDGADACHVTEIGISGACRSKASNSLQFFQLLVKSLQIRDLILERVGHVYQLLHCTKTLHEQPILSSINNTMCEIYVNRAC